MNDPINPPPSEWLQSLEQLPHAAFAPDSPPDRDARLAALDPEGSFAVAAPAGSGKTGLLTQRVLTLLARCQAPEEVLAITFTRKAAGEMQERIMAALRDAAEQPAPEDPHKRRTWTLARAVLEQDQQHQWQLLMTPQRLRIQTIDSLCRAITQQLPLDSLLGAQPDTLEDADSAYRQAVHNLFALLETEHAVQADLQQLLRHMDTNLSAVETLLVRLLAKREQWLGVMLEASQQHARGYLEAVLTDVINDQLQDAWGCLRPIASDLCLLADRAAANALEDSPESPVTRLAGITGLPDTTPDALPDWLALAELLLTKDGEWRKQLNKNIGFPAGKVGAPLKDAFKALLGTLQELDPQANQVLQALRQLPPPAYTDSQWQLLDSLTRLLPHLAAQLTLVFKQLGATDFSAITQAANAALGDDDNPTDIALKLDYQIRHILVDEFQDTAAPQRQLLERLTAGWQPGDGRTLFIVGDGMQSCYGFRDANVGLFLDARNGGIGEVPLTAIDLQVNFRSQTEIVRWVNRVFAQAFPARDDIGRGAVSYAPSIAFNAPLAGPAVTVYGCLHQAEQEAADSEALHPDASPDKILAQWREAESVALLAEQALREDPEGSVAILVRGRRHLQWILPALARRQLHWQATEIDPLSSRMAIVDLMSLTRALLNPDDRIAWLAMLRAPWCGLDLHDLERLVTADVGEYSPRLNNRWPVIWQQLLHRQHITGLSAAGQACLERLMAVLEPAWQQRQRKPLRQWLEGIWLALGGPALLLDSADRDNLPSYFALLEQHQWGGGLRDWRAFERAVEGLYAAPRPDADPRLQVMTLHKSKGLEFDTVIIPGLDRKSASNDKELLLWQQRISRTGERQLLLGPLAPTGQSSDPLYQFMRTEAKLRDSYEATRLLYVGCTRAIKRLHLLACISLHPKTGTATVPSGSLLASIWPQVAGELQTPPAPSPEAPAVADTAAGQAQPGLQHLVRLVPDWRAPPAPEGHLLGAYRGREYDDEDNTPAQESRQARLARHIGTLLHGQLQVLTEQRIRQWDEAWGEARARQWRVQLQQLGWQGRDLAQAIEDIRRGLQLTLADPRGRWLLDHDHQDSQCELAIEHIYPAHSGRVRESVIDRTFVVEGVRWIVDYKSSRPEAGEPLADFLARERLSYQAQLQRYAQALTALENLPVRTALYFPLVEQGERLLIINDEATKD